MKKQSAWIKREKRLYFPKCFPNSKTFLRNKLDQSIMPKNILCETKRSVVKFSAHRQTWFLHLEKLFRRLNRKRQLRQIKIKTTERMAKHRSLIWPISRHRWQPQTLTTAKKNKQITKEFFELSKKCWLALIRLNWF